MKPTTDLTDLAIARHVEAGGLDTVPNATDPLAEALHDLRMDGVFYCRSELTAPWGLELPPMPDCLWFHVVTHGECTIIDSGGHALLLRAGDVVVLPHGAGHLAGDDSATPMTVVFDVPHHYVSRHYALLRHGGGGAPTNLVCGLVHLGHPSARMLIDALPEMIHIDGAARQASWEWLPSMLSLMAAEAQTTRPGGETVVTRLCDVLVIQAIRAWLDNDPAAQTGWIRALRDPEIGRAISAIHREPARDWTVASLAQLVAMSRSSFSARFTDLVGHPPKQYVTAWRMRLAEDLLRRDELTIAQIAAELGYGSDAAFSRAFSREIGVAPSRVRHESDVVDLARAHGID